jgi:cytochrome c556
MKKTYKMVLCGVLVACFVTAAYAQFAKPEDAINYRKAVMTLIGHHFMRIAAVVKGQQPYDRDVVTHDATLVETFSKLPWEAFRVPGTDKGPTQLMPEAFREPSRFSEDAKRFEAEAAKLAGAAAGGNLDAIKNQFGEVGKACQECHKQFRAR